MSSKLSRVASQLPALKTSLLGLAEGVAGREIHGGNAFQSRVMEALVRPISTSVIQAKTGGEAQDTSLQQRESNVPVARGRGRGRGRSDQLAPMRGVFGECLDHFCPKFSFINSSVFVQLGDREWNSGCKIHNYGLY
jgi:hypothetical protein